MMKRNALMSELCGKTYYFSYAEGIKKRNLMKKREILSEPKKITKSGLGFDLNIDENLMFNEDSKEVK